MHTRESRVRNHKKTGPGPSENHDRKLFTLLVGRRNFTIVHCSRFWDHMFKIAQNRKKTGPGPSENHDRELLTFLAGRRKFTIVHCSRFWDHMFKITQNRQKTGLGVRQIIIYFSESPEVSKIIIRILP